MTAMTSKARSTRIPRMTPAGVPAHPTTAGRTCESSDESLLVRFCTSHDETAFETLVHRYERELFGFLRRYLHDAELAEDVFQTTFLRVYLKAESFEAGRSFRPWLYAIATHQAIDAQRRQKRHRMLPLDERRPGAEEAPACIEMLSGDDPRADERVQTEETRASLQTALGRLSAAHRSVLTLVYYQGIKQREAARLLGVPVGTVKSRLHAAVHKLATAWARPELRPVLSGGPT
jgi:RNA polymerase sigma-70 factor (ECF subfamily)